MRAVVASVVVGGCLLAAASAAVADTVVSGGGSTIGASGSSGGSGPPSQPGPPPAPTGGGPPTYLALIPVIVGPGEYCLEQEYLPSGTPVPPVDTSGDTQVPCPPSTGGGGGGAPPPPTPGTVLAQSWSQQATLPSPTMAVPPGYAVTGLPAYLEINTPAGAGFTFAGGGNSVSVGCAHTGFTISWGDGTTSTATDTGGPYPSGDITHVYADASPGVALQVTEHWACHWTDKFGAGGQLTGLASGGTLPLEVREIQTFNS